MDSKRYAIFKDKHGEYGWYVFKNLYQARKAVDNGLAAASGGVAGDAFLYGANYTGMILTERGMIREGYFSK